ncbi:MAG: glycosyltransferase family 4 protein [Chloroflexi bacterium]|nr:glycosyltransferase family 4 protein [Chloroflexota bacterium]
MKIALVSPYDYFYPGGVVKHISHLDQEFRAAGHEVRIITPASAQTEDLPPHLIVASSNILPVPYAGSVARITLSPRVYFRVKKILKEEAFDIVHSHEPLSPALPLAVLRHSRALNVGTFHAYREKHAAYYYAKPLFKRFFARLHGRIVVSEPVREYLSKYFPAKYVVIPNGIELEPFTDPQVQPIAKFVDDKLNILFVGRLEKRKGFRHLLAAYARLRDQLPAVRLLVVGAFTREDKAPYLRYVRAERIRDVNFIGPVSDEDLPRYYKTAHVFCAPSTGFESFGMVLLEAMAAGVPVVASDIPGYHTVLSPNQEGVLVPPRKDEPLAQAILQLLQNPQERERMGEAGKKKAQEYTWDKIAKQVLDYYQELLAQRKNGKR